MKPKYKCTYTARLGAACPTMWSHNKPHPSHCHAYDCSIWRINPKLTCKYCVPLEDGEKPEKKIWCDQMDSCDSYTDGGIKNCWVCPARTIVFRPITSTDKVLVGLEKWAIKNCDKVLDGHIPAVWLADLREEIQKIRKKLRREREQR